MVRADIAIAVGRRATAPALGCSHSLEGQQRARHCGRRAPQIFEQLLDVCEAGNTISWLRSCLALAVRISHHDFGFQLGLGRNVRQAVHVLQTDRTDERYNVRLLCPGSILLCERRPPALCPFVWANRVENAPEPRSATKTPNRQSTDAIKTRRLKKADFEVDFFFMVEAELFPSAVNPRR